METDKSTRQYIDTIESANNSDHDVPLKHVNSANEEIVQHLQTTGEEIGMTWRTFMAAAVRSLDIRETSNR
jgi:heme oxygenase